MAMNSERLEKRKIWFQSPANHKHAKLTEYHKSGVKKSWNVHLSSGQAHLNINLSCCQITLGIQGNITLHCIFFNLSVGHLMKIYACPDWNFTCPGLQDKWFFTRANDEDHYYTPIWSVGQHKQTNIWWSLGEFRYERYESVYVTLLTVY